jgi:hypothetical protein
MVAFDGPWPTATRTGSVPLEVAGELVAYQLLLQIMEDLLCLPEPQTYVLDPLARAFNRLDRDAEWQRVGGFDQQWPVITDAPRNQAYDRHTAVFFDYKRGKKT